MKIPTRKDCMKILEEHEVPENILRHSLAVTRIAVYLAKELKKKGEGVNFELVQAAGLLHDVAKYECIVGDSDLEHSARGKELLEKAGYPEVGAVVAKHLYDPILNRQIKTWEEILLIYSDAVVEGNKILSLEERLKHLNKRYPHLRETFEKTAPIILEMEKKIFSKIGQTPDVVNKLEVSQ